MGSGKAKYANLNSGVSDDACLDKATYDSMSGSIKEHLSSLSDTDVDELLVAELKDWNS